MLIASGESVGIPTELPINSGPQMHYVLQRAVNDLDEWMRTGAAPASADRLEVDDHGKLVVDRVGIARGGVRTPWVDAPTRIVSGLGQPGNMAELFGTTRMLDAPTLAELYPQGLDDFLRQFRDATRAAIDSGFVLDVDRAEIEALGALAWPDRVPC
jgi:hypothetical protein